MVWCLAVFGFIMHASQLESVAVEHADPLPYVVVVDVHQPVLEGHLPAVAHSLQLVRVVHARVFEPR